MLSHSWWYSFLHSTKAIFSNCCIVLRAAAFVAFYAVLQKEWIYNKTIVHTLVINFEADSVFNWMFFLLPCPSLPSSVCVCSIFKLVGSSCHHPQYIFDHTAEAWFPSIWKPYFKHLKMWWMRSHWLCKFAFATNWFLKTRGARCKLLILCCYTILYNELWGHM